MPRAEAPEFDLQRPLPSAIAVIRAVLFSPKNFYLTFSAQGPVKEPAVFALLSPLAVGVVAGVYLLSIRIFVGKTSSFREVYRMAAYASGALILAWTRSWEPSPLRTPSSTYPTDNHSRLAFQVALGEDSREIELALV